MWPLKKTSEKEEVKPPKKALRLTIYLDKTCIEGYRWYQITNVDRVDCSHFKDFLHWYHGRKQSESFSVKWTRGFDHLLREKITHYTIRLLDEEI